MKASELIAKLSELQTASGGDPEVLGQSHGCCYHGHTIEAVGMGLQTYEGVGTADEIGAIIIRV